MAQWLARHLEHVAVLHENSPIIYALIKLDEIHGDPAAVAATLGEALNANLPAPPADIFGPPHFAAGRWREFSGVLADAFAVLRSEEHTSELQSLMRISYAFFCLKKKKTKPDDHKITTE